MYNVALWGTGKGYNEFISCHGYEMVKVVAIIDKTYLYKKIDGFPVIKPQGLMDILQEIDYLIVTVLDEYIYKDIIIEAVALGVPREMIVPLRIFKVPFFNFEEYVKIKKSNISLLSDTCLGGCFIINLGFSSLVQQLTCFHIIKIIISSLTI